MKSIFPSAILLVTFSLQVQAPTSNPVPIQEEPQHHLRLDNEYVRVWEFSLPGQEATLQPLRTIIPTSESLSGPEISSIQ
jgi:hypothetical protein